MSFIKRISNLFKIKPIRIEAKLGGGYATVTLEELMRDEVVANLLSTYKKKTTLLQPNRSDKEIDFTQSKMGGMPNLNGFQAWPICDECNVPLNFVLQLYKTDFPDFYFPENKNIFQLFRCPNHDCTAAYSVKESKIKRGKKKVIASYSEYDLRMFHYYQNVNTDKNNEVKIPESDSEKFPNLEKKVQEFYFEPEISDDYPNIAEYPEDEWANFENKYGYDRYKEDGVIKMIDKGIGLFEENFSTKRAMKFGGYPSWVQNPNYPVCECGIQKEFFFQLTWGFQRPGHKYDDFFPAELIGIYYFRCKKCGEKSIESRCDFT